MRKGVLIVIDGIAGSGKSTIVQSLEDWAEDQKLRVFDLLKWSQEQSRPPMLDDVKEYDLLFTFEPTKQWIGSAIRQEMSRTDQPYSGVELAHAFSLDRLIQYRRLIIPTLQAGKNIIQDRSVSSSIAYQPIMSEGPTLKDLMQLPGNALALEHAPNHLILTDVPVEKVFERFKRADESKGVFEDIKLLKKINSRYRSDWFRKIFTDRGTTIHDLDTSLDIEQMKSNAKKFITSFLEE
ncbi:deoxynucleoside kinase [Patescibacteria group bacterium]|nr:deoxynucleoside kinase [Patescibacteria group bacterium]